MRSCGRLVRQTETPDTARARRDPSGAVVGAMARGRDATERYLAERAKRGGTAGA